MNTLFPIESQYPEGFRYQDQFITVAEETELLSVIQQVTLQTFQFQGYESKRKVASFGRDWSFESRQLRQGKAIPAGFQWLIERVAETLTLPTETIVELLITEYPAGSVINWHRDAPPFALIAGVSLNADCTFKLRPYEKEKQTRKAVMSLRLPRRSLYVMRGEAREAWQHSSLPVQGTRYSITLRTLKEGIIS